MEALLLLADGRFPGGGYAHSGGLEAAVAEGAVRTIDDLDAFVTGRLTTTGLTDAWLAAGACLVAGVAAALAALDDECDARTPSARLREASRSLGRGLRRAASASWPAVASTSAQHQPVVLGVVAAAAGLDPLGAAHLALHAAMMGPLGAAPKLLPLDMADALAVAARLAPLVDVLALDAMSESLAPRSAPALDERAERHATWEVRLFAT
jgi:urease accessory protein